MNAWQNLAHCAEADPEIFFPERWDEASTAEAKSVCASCPVRFECLTDALQRMERHGIWGGLTEQERRKVTRLPHRCRHCRGPVLAAAGRYCSQGCRLAATRRRRAASPAA
ncbi:hypothetical protein Psi01_05410 [Planobispora siamensis]|uniref:Transcriptional regulator WhiB n=1 Tax=Planobispora siamensis TaxID=936338 RepID=A0A8J3WJJ5_9ACTN|nr:WhiB family transcriptional regulator [Planobispora siamensis]GIH89911.1 hypothetical protein Psi01_05410 [Planobispora siamensis]